MSSCNSSSSRGRTRVVEVNIRSPDFSKVKKSGEIYAKLWVEGNEKWKLKTGNLLTLSPRNSSGCATWNFSHNNIGSSICFEIYRTRKHLRDKLLGRAKCVATEELLRVRVEKGSVVIGELGMEMVVKKLAMEKEEFMGVDEEDDQPLQENKCGFHFAWSCFRKSATKD